MSDTLPNATTIGAELAAQPVEREGFPPMTGAEIAGIVAGFSERTIDGEHVALGSSSAVKILKEQRAARAENRPFRLADMRLSPRDLDLIYSGKDFEGYIGEISKLYWRGEGLKSLTPDSNFEGLRNYPRTTFYAGILNITTSTRDHLEVEVFDNFTYGGKNKAGQPSDRHPIFTMQVPNSRFKEIVDDDGVSVTVPDASIVALLSFLYAREGKDDLDRAKSLIDVYLSEPNNDIFTLMEVAKQVCPHKSMPFARFVLEYIEENHEPDKVLEHYFGAKSGAAFNLTKKMIGLFDPEDFPYHNFFEHVLPTLQLTKKLLEAGLIDHKYSQAVMLAVYAHESGLNVAEGYDGHVERGSDLVEGEDRIAGVLVNVTNLKYVEEDGLVPAMFLDAERESLAKDLTELGVPYEEAEKMLYLMGFTDIANIIKHGGIIKSFEVLQEDYLEKLRTDEAISEDFISNKGSAYISLYRNLRDGILSRMDRDYAFSRVFYETFSTLNNVDYEEIRRLGGSVSAEVRAELISLVGDKVDFWKYVQDRPMVQALIQEKYHEMLFAVKDPRVRAKLHVDLDEYVNRIYERSIMQKLIDEGRHTIADSQ